MYIIMHMKRSTDLNHNENDDNNVHDDYCVNLEVLKRGAWKLSNPYLIYGTKSGS